MANTTHPPTAPPSPVLQMDVEHYERMLENSDLTPDQRQDLLEALWSMIVIFVDLGFCVEPVAHSCEQMNGGSNESGSTGVNPLYFEDNSLIKNFVSADLNAGAAQGKDTE